MGRRLGAEKGQTRLTAAVGGHRIRLGEVCTRALDRQRCFRGEDEMRGHMGRAVFAAAICAVFMFVAAAADKGKDEATGLEKAFRQRQADEAERASLAEALLQWRHKLGVKIAENERALVKAKGAEDRDADRGDRYFEKKDFRRAKTYYGRALTVTFYQWVIAETPSAKEMEDKDFKPKTRKRKFRPATNRTADIYEKLAAMDRLIAEGDLAGHLARADQALDAGKLWTAHKGYDAALRFAQRMGDNEFAVKSSAKARAQQEQILDVVSKPLTLAEMALDEKQPAKALDAVEEFETKFGAFKNDKETCKRYNKIVAQPVLQKEKREREARKLLASGESAFGRDDYLTASKRFGTAGTTYGDTEAGEAARKKLAAMLADEEIARAIKLQESEFVCKGLMARASMLIKQDKYKEALAVYEGIMEEHANTPWSVKAAELKGQLLEEMKAGD